MIERLARVLSLGMVAFLSPASVLGQDVDHALTTDKAEYFRDEPVVLEAKTCNNTAVPQTYFWGPTCGSLDLEIRRAGEIVAFHAIEGEDDFGCPAVVYETELDPGECNQRFKTTWHQQAGGFPFPGDGVQLEPGEYLAESHFGSAVFQLKSGPRPVPSLSQLQVWVLIVLLGTVGALTLARR